MMEPLRNEANSADPEVANAARLLASAHRPHDSVVAKARVRRAVMARLSGVGARARLRPSVVVGIVLLATSAAVASVTWVVTRWIENQKKEAEVSAPKRVLETIDSASADGAAVRRTKLALEVPTTALGVDSTPGLVAPPARGTRTANARKQPAMRAKSTPTPTPAEVSDDASEPVAPAPVAAPAPIEPPRPAIAKTLLVARGPVEALAPQPVAPPAVKPEPTPEPTPETAVGPEPDAELALVQAAFSALRQEGNPGKAARALDAYLRKYPGGKLAEEALGLAIEAYATLDDARAAERAAQYLERFPAGRFKLAASRALSRFPH